MPTQVTPNPARRPPPTTIGASLHGKPAPTAYEKHDRRRRRTLVAVAVLLLIVMLLVGPAPAFADSASHVLSAAAPPTAPTLATVIDGLRNWLIGLLAAVATLFLTIGGIRYITAGGDPMQVERAKTALKSAAIGYSLAALAPLLVDVLRSIVG